MFIFAACSVSVRLIFFLMCQGLPALYLTYLHMRQHYAHLCLGFDSTSPASSSCVRYLVINPDWQIIIQNSLGWSFIAETWFIDTIYILRISCQAKLSESCVILASVFLLWLLYHRLNLHWRGKYRYTGEGVNFTKQGLTGKKTMCGNSDNYSLIGKHQHHSYG